MTLKPSDYDKNGDIIPDGVADITYEPWWTQIFNQDIFKQTQYNAELLAAFELLKAHCKNRDCNKDCIFFREVNIGKSKDQYCALCEIVMSDDKEAKNGTK